MAPTTTTTLPAPLPGWWSNRSLAITATSLGGVQVGMTLDQAQWAAGLVFDTQGDGVHYPTTLPKGYADLFVDLGDKGQVRCVGAVGSMNDTDTITTPEGFRLGDSLGHLKAIYGNRLTHIPNPVTGIEPRDGYVVKEGNSFLVFSYSKGVVWGVAAGSEGFNGEPITPSNCIS
jgi:hypothetical protein